MPYGGVGVFGKVLLQFSDPVLCNRPISLYHFSMRAYHFLNRRYGLDNLQQRRLKIATINSLNDPFEMIAAASPNSSIRDALLRTKDELATLSGLLCFSRNWHNAVQWSHYAEAHHGVCLGFEIPDDLLTPVRYQSKRMIIDSDMINDAFMRALISTKSSHWRYENEVRCFLRLNERDPETALFFAPFSEELALREVIVGHRSTVSRSELTAALGDLASSVKMTKARLAFRSFRIVTQRRMDMWN